MSNQGTALSFQRVGHKGPRVVLVMGYGMSGRAWEPQITGLGRDFQLLTYDHRGIGDSAPTAPGLSMSSMADDLEQLVDHLGWSSDLHLVGVSMGGMIAQEFALTRTKRLASLTLIATHAGGPTGLAPRVKGLKNFLNVRFGPVAQRPVALAKLLHPEGYLRVCNRAQLQARLRSQLATPPSRITVRRQLMAIAKHDTRRRLPSLEVPTLVVKPELDILVRPSHSETLSRLIPNSTLVRIPDAGHGLLYQKAALVNHRIAEHFQAHTPR